MVSKVIDYLMMNKYIIDIVIEDSGYIYIPYLHRIFNWSWVLPRNSSNSLDRSIDCSNTTPFHSFLSNIWNTWAITIVPGMPLSKCSDVHSCKDQTN